MCRSPHNIKLSRKEVKAFAKKLGFHINKMVTKEEYFSRYCGNGNFYLPALIGMAEREGLVIISLKKVVT